MNRTNFIFDSAQLMYCKRHKVNFKRASLYIDFPDCIKMKKTTINPINEYDKCLQYGLALALNYETIKWNPERVSNIKQFRNKYN